MTEQGRVFFAKVVSAIQTLDEAVEVLLAWRRTGVLSPAAEAFKRFSQSWFAP